MKRRSTGHVSLVGGGPGDPELLTRKAVARLRGADLVLYDALIDPRVLRFARRAQKFFVGKRAGRHALAQTEINALLIRAAIHSCSGAAGKRRSRSAAPASRSTSCLA
jgi:siroheme synthase